MDQLNVRERKVLTLLEANARMPAATIARKLQMSTQGVLKLLSRLEIGNFVLKYNTKINYSLLGYQLYPVHIKLIKKDRQTIELIKQKIKKYRTCVWHSFCEGEYDLFLSIEVSSVEDKKEMENLLSELSEFAVIKDVSIVISAYEYSICLNEHATDASRLEQQNSFLIFDSYAKKVELSTQEKELLYLLKGNSRQSLLDIAKKLNTTPRVCSYAIKKLTSCGIISGFKTKLNLAKLGFHPYVALIQFSLYSQSDFEKFVSYCRQHERIYYFIRQIGQYDGQISFYAKDIYEFYTMVEDLRNTFSFVKKVNALIVKQDF